MGALVVLGGLLLAILAGDAFRHSIFLRLNDLGERWSFVPLTLLPIAVVALIGGWLAFLWGAMRGSIWVALTGAFVHLLINGSIGDLLGGIGPSLLSRIGPTVNRVGYWAVAGVVVGFALINLKPAWGRRARYVALPLLAAALIAMYGALLLLALQAFESGFPAQATLALDGNVESISALLQPMIVLASVALVDFSYTFATAVTSPASRAPGPHGEGGAAGRGRAVKLWFQFFSQIDHWAAFVRISASGVFWVVVTAAGFAAVGLWWRSLVRRGAVGEAGEERVKERIVYIGIAAEIIPSFIVITAHHRRQHHPGPGELASRGGVPRRDQPVHVPARDDRADPAVGRAARRGSVADAAAAGGAPGASSGSGCS